MFENTGKSNLKELGEFGLIKHLTSDLKIKNSSTIKGVGDDAAVIDSGNYFTLVTTDMLVEGVHFNMIYSPLKHLGYKAVTVNLSDIYAMGGKPEQITVALAISSKYTIEALEEFYLGMKIACEKYGVDLVGGDTTSSYSGLVISITAIGMVEKNQVIYRNGAKEKDLICVSGDLGAAFMGLKILEREMEVYKASPDIQPDLEGFDYILERQLKPEPRKDVIEYLQSLEITPTAMIDISDGLASEIIHICSQSETGCMIYEEKLPIDHSTQETALELNIDPTTCALNGGEDYELLFTISLNDYEKIKDSNLISVIGHITDKNAGYSLVTKDNKVHEIKAQGWNAFN